MIEKLLEPIIDSFTTGKYYKEIYQAKKEYFDKTGPVYEDDIEFDQRMSIFMDWYLFDRDLPEFDLPPIKHFFKINKNDFSEKTRLIYNDLCQTQHSIFRLKRKTWNKNGVVIQDLFSGLTLTVMIPDINRGFYRGDIFEARVIKYLDSYCFSKGFCFHPTDVSPFILDEIKKVRNQDKKKQLKLILQLSGMKLKHLRFQHIDITHIYQMNSKF